MHLFTYSLCSSWMQVRMYTSYFICIPKYVFVQLSMYFDGAQPLFTLHFWDKCCFISCITIFNLYQLRRLGLLWTGNSDVQSSCVSSFLLASFCKVISLPEFWIKLATGKVCISQSFPAKCYFTIFMTVVDPLVMCSSETWQWMWMSQLCLYHNWKILKTSF